jgi:multidrug efflux system membrane fusion protein
VKDAVVIPVAAIQRGQPGTFVYLAKADDTVAIRVVQLGATDGDKQQILSGLEVGDQVVIDGTDRLRDGAKIRRPGERNAGAPVAAAPTDKPAAAAPGQRPDQRGAQGGGQGDRPQRRRQANNAGDGARPAPASQ